MGLHRFKPIPSGRMGILWTLSTIRDAAVVEFGCMGHMLYSGVTLKRAGVNNGCRLYSTHIDETDIALGGTNRLSHTIDYVIKHDRPRGIFLLPSAIPQVIGTDLNAICEELQPQYPDVRMIPFGYGGFDVVQHRGVEQSLLQLVKMLPRDMEKTLHPSFNIIGSCADLYRFQADADEMIRIMKGAFDLKPLCVLTSDTSVEEIENLGGAHINLVIRREGQLAAEHLKARFGTPYLLCRPYGIEGTIRWMKEIETLSGFTADVSFLYKEREAFRRRIAPVMPHFRHIARSHPEEAKLSLGGHADVVKGILSFGCDELAFYKGTCWCDCPYMASEDIPYFSEEEWTRAVQEQEKGFLMASGEALEWAGRSREVQISNPDTKWHLYPYEPPFAGFRGAMHLANLWANENIENSRG